MAFNGRQTSKTSKASAAKTLDYIEEVEDGYHNNL